MWWIFRHPVLTALLSAAVAAGAGFAGDIVFHRTWLIVVTSCAAQLALIFLGPARENAAARVPRRVLTIGLVLAGLAGLTIVLAATGWTRWWLYLSVGPVLYLLLPAKVDELDERAEHGWHRTTGARSERAQWRLLSRCDAMAVRANRLADRGRYAKARRLFLRAERKLRRTLGAGHESAILCRLAAAGFLARQGDTARAMAEFGTALADLTRRLGADHPHVRAANAAYVGLSRAPSGVPGSVRRHEEAP
ncbi:MAG TPA: tetratricopeptide repeat protein [Actinocatenispora sp.]